MSARTFDDPKRIDQLVAWARYLHWANIHRESFVDLVEADSDLHDWPTWWKFFALQSAWYASLWVVIEGWKEARFQDAGVAEILDAAPRFQKLLQRHRNGIFHYQPVPG